MKTLMIAALLGTVAAGGIAVAQSAASPAARIMRGDVDADGKLSRSEFVKQAEARFAMLDVDKDGSLTRAETRFGREHGGRRGRFGAFRQDGPPSPGGRGAGMLGQDADGDGKVTRAEFDAQTTAMFARIDPNSDGTVDKAEMAALPGAGRMAARADGDGNGALTRAEFAAQAATRFARMDSNGDGTIDAAELRSRGGRPGARPAVPTPPAPSGA